MWSDRRKWLVVTSSCSLTLQVAERGSWLFVVITCKTCLTSVNDPDHYIRVDYVGHPDISWKPSGCFMLISVVWPSLRQAGYEGASCVSGWYACYVSLWGVWHVFLGGGVPIISMVFIYFFLLKGGLTILVRDYKAKYFIVVRPYTFEHS